MPKNVHLDPDYQKKYREQPEHSARQKGYKLRMREKKKEVLREAIGECCAHCGTTERLELDHINPLVGGHLIILYLTIEHQREG